MWRVSHGLKKAHEIAGGRDNTKFVRAKIEDKEDRQEQKVYALVERVVVSANGPLIQDKG